jgi:hypothetical protein
MLPGFETLGIRFDANKIKSGGYGDECWKLVWKVVNQKQLPGAFLWEGDTAATLQHRENVYCIVIQCNDPLLVQTLRDALSECPDFARVQAYPPFIYAGACQQQPLVDAGRVDPAGNLIGHAHAQAGEATVPDKEL